MEQSIMPVKKYGNRQSNLELLRILCIIAIIGDHFIGQNSLGAYVSIPETFFYVSLNSLSRVGCSVFVIISAWFSVDLSFRFRKIVHIWLTVAMFSLCFLLWELMHPEFSEGQMQQLVYPVEEYPLWFAGFFIILMGFSPVLNLLLREGSRRLIEYLLFILGVFMVGYTTVTARLGFFSSDIWPMLFLYMLTGYWKKYCGIPSLSRAMRWFLITWMVLTGCRVIGMHLPSGSGTDMLRKYAETYRARMQTIPNLLMAYGLFFTFYHLKIKSIPVMNKLAGLSLGVYCFHQLPGWYPFLWNSVLHASFHATGLPGIKRALYASTGIIAVWLMGSLAEFIRSCIAAVLIENRSWFDRLCRRADSLVNGTEEDFSVSDRKWIRWFVLIVILWFLITPVLFSSQLYRLFR